MKMVDFENGKFIATFPYRREVVDFIRTFPSKRFDPNRVVWEISATPGNLEKILALVQDFGFSEGKDFQKGLSLIKEEIKKRLENIEASKKAHSEINIEGLKGELRPFQKAGVEYAMKNKRVFIADEMGLGKTIQAIATIQAERLFPSLIVCPASLKWNWKIEFEKWLNDIKVKVLNGRNKKEDFDADVLIINYDVLQKNLEELLQREIKCVVFDEFHYTKSGKAQRSKAALQIASKSEYVLGLTGTPVLNRPAELINPLKILRRLDEFGGFWKFATRYAGAFRGRFGIVMNGAENLDELNEKLRERCYIRRNKKDVLTELPDKQISEIYVDLSNRKEYERAESELVNYLVEQALKEKEFIESIKGLSEDEQLVAKHERAMSKEMKIRRAEHLVKIEALKQVSARGKLEAVTEWIDNFLESEEKLVVFATHKEIIQAITEKYKCKSITGETATEERQRIVEDFQENKETKLIVLNLKAGGVGLTLTQASNLIFVELGWTPADHQQAEDRIHRIGQKNVANIYYFLGKDSIDEYIYQVLQDKKQVVNATTEGGEIEAEGILSKIINHLTKKEI
jgi:SNF2 family DNA or RNA helicase